MFIVVIKIDTCKFYFSFFIEYVLVPVVPGLEGTSRPRRTSWTERGTSESILIIVQIERVWLIDRSAHEVASSQFPPAVLNNFLILFSLDRLRANKVNQDHQEKQVFQGHQ